MQIAFHIGANCTDEDRLLKSILRNSQVLLEQGIAVPGPSKYRSLLRETIQGLDGVPPPSDTREILLDAIVEQENITRLVLCNDNFITVPKRVFDHGVFYPQTEAKIRGICDLFPHDDLSFFLGIRNPASWLQAVARTAGVTRLRDYLGLLPPLEITWSSVIKRIKRAAPDAPVYVWCTEDTPLIWEDLIRLQSGVSDDTKVTGRHDMISRVVTSQGREALKLLPSSADRIERHDTLATILETYGDEDLMEDEIDYPEIGQDLVDVLTKSYEADLAVIDAIDGVSLILPFR